MSTATAPIAGPGHSTWLSVLRFIRRAFTLNVGGAHGSRERRAFTRFAIGIPVANTAGAVDVFLFLWFVAPIPAIHDRAQVRLVNGIALAVVMAVTFLICGSLCNKCAEPIARWLDSGEPADEAMVRRVLRFPFT